MMMLGWWSLPFANQKMKSILTRVLAAVLAISATMGAGAALANDPIRIDGSSDQAAERSFRRMMQARDRDAQMQLAMAMLQINMAGVSSASEMLANPELRNPSITRIRGQVDGMTAEEMIALAAAGDIGGFIQGEEPGVAPGLLAPLEEGPVARPLAGTTWTITSDINGHISQSTVRLDAEGEAYLLEANADSDQKNTWQQSGDEFRLSINDEFVVYRGRMEGDALVGAAGNINGTEWTWTAEQENQSTAQ